jgi:hypothetical protein
MLFIDNLHPIFIEYFRSCKQVNGLTEMSDSGEQILCDFAENTVTYSLMSELLDWVPRTDLKSVSKLIVRTKV